eukprot:365378-Chlamydomonas_euryale.AAC.11
MVARHNVPTTHLEAAVISIDRVYPHPVAMIRRLSKLICSQLQAPMNNLRSASKLVPHQRSVLPAACSIWMSHTSALGSTCSTCNA